jgi:hypothetical protein
VQSKQGTVSIKNLNLNCSVLNEYLESGPLKIIEAEITELSATISYDSMLDGCHLICHGMRVVIAPREQNLPIPHNKPHFQDTSPTKDAGVKDSNSRKMASAENENDEDRMTDETLGFIAQWIEVVIARMKVTVEDLNILFMESTVSSVGLQLCLSSLVFHNSHPGLVREQGSSAQAVSSSRLSMSASVGASVSRSFIAAMGHRKVTFLPFQFLFSPLIVCS